MIRAAVSFLLLMTVAGCSASRLMNLGVDDPDSREHLRRQWITYATNEGIHLARGDGTDAIRIVRREEIGDRAAVFLPSLSPDETRLFFLSLVELEVHDSTGTDLALHILDLEGRTVRRRRTVNLSRILPPDEDGRLSVFAVSAASWSRDSRRIALGLNREHLGQADGIILFDATGEPLHGFDLVDARLPEVGSLSWGPDDRTLITELSGTTGEGGTIAQLRLESSTRAATWRSLGRGEEPVMSPDGERIAFVDTTGETWDLVLVDPEGTELRRFERPPGRALHRPFWSRDGRYLYYYSLASTGPLGLIEVTILRCLDTDRRQVFDLVRLR